MTAKQGVLLTGATGLLGRYLLRDLLLAQRPVTILVRPAPGRQPQARVAELLASWSEQLGRRLPTPVVLIGDVRLPWAGLEQTDRHWLARRCHGVLHAAANLSFRADPLGEPWQTNVGGTENLLQLSSALGLLNWHFVSTAFVSGCRSGLIREEELDVGQEFHNDYERSKLAAEQLVQTWPGLSATIFRPAVIVGDSRTGYTSSYSGLYKFLALAARLVDGQTLCPGQQRRHLPLRLPLSGAEPMHLVPVDWVAGAIVKLIGQPRWHGWTFHLVPRQPLPSRVIYEVAAEELGLDGVDLVGPGQMTQPSRLEEIFLDGLREYWPYVGADVRFAERNTAAALPHFPPPGLDREMLRRLIRFAVRAEWGRAPAPPVAGDPYADSGCARYFEQTFPKQAHASELARAIGLHACVGFDIFGPAGGQWTCRWEHGEFRGVERGVSAMADVVYRTDLATFRAILARRQCPQQAFFEERIAITGAVELALKLVTVFECFLAEQPAGDHLPEALDANGV